MGSTLFTEITLSEQANLSGGKRNNRSNSRGDSLVVISNSFNIQANVNLTTQVAVGFVATNNNFTIQENSIS